MHKPVAGTKHREGQGTQLKEIDDVPEDDPELPAINVAPLKETANAQIQTPGSGRLPSKPPGVTGKVQPQAASRFLKEQFP